MSGASTSAGVSVHPSSMVTIQTSFDDCQTHTCDKVRCENICLRLIALAAKSEGLSATPTHQCQRRVHASSPPVPTGSVVGSRFGTGEYFSIAIDVHVRRPEQLDSQAFQRPSTRQLMMKWLASHTDGAPRLWDVVTI